MKKPFGVTFRELATKKLSEINGLLLKTDDVYLWAEDFIGKIVYGGEFNLGAIDGLDPHAVYKAAISHGS